MITATTHTLSAELTKSTQDFRSILDQRVSANENEVSTPQEPTEGTVPLEAVQEPEQAQETTIDYEKLNSDIESRRETARQAAVHMTELQHKKNMVDTYMNAASDDDTSSSSEIEPLEVYQTSLKYSRRMDLINAFEAVAQNESNSPHISVLV